MKSVVWFLSVGIVVLLFAVADAAFGQPPPSALAVFHRLTGTPFASGDARRETIEQLLGEGKLKEAARIAQSDPHFLDIKVRDLAAQYTNVDENPVVPFDDLQALFIGLARDNVDFRQILTGDLRYQAGANRGLTAPTLKANTHHQEMEKKRLRASEVLERHEPQWENTFTSAGALTTYSFAKAHYSAGTNRRAFKYAFQEFLCRKPEVWRDASVPDDFVRKDVDRAPAKRPDTYQTDCRGCHAGMDAMDGAFAQFDFKDQSLVILPVGGVVPKMNQNEHVYEFAEKTMDSRWVNYLTVNHNEDIGWHGKTEGNGIREFGEMIANADGFADCLAERVFRQVCRVRHPPRDAVQELGTAFREGGYLIKELFVASAVHPQCVTTAGIKNFREIYETFKIATGLPEDDTRVAAFEVARDKLPRYGYADEINPAMRQSLVTLASKFCEDKVRSEMQKAKETRTWFRSFDDEEIGRTVGQMAKSFWGRAASDSERGLLTSIAGDFPDAAQNAESGIQMATSVCLVVASSFETLSLH